MSLTILTGALAVAQLLLGLAMACAVARLALGPRAQDRVLALDTLYVDAMLLVLCFGIRVGDAVYFEVALLIAALGFVSDSSPGEIPDAREIIE